MSPRARVELIRREFAKEAREGDFEQSFVREIVIVAKEMGGWSIESILKMPILRYGEVRKALKHLYEEERKAMEQARDKGRGTFR